jgi:hypothetical protein
MKSCIFPHSVYLAYPHLQKSHKGSAVGIFNTLLFNSFQETIFVQFFNHPSGFDQGLRVTLVTLAFLDKLFELLCSQQYKQMVSIFFAHQ